MIKKPVVKSIEFSSTIEVENFLTHRINDEGDCFEDLKVVTNDQGNFIVFYVERDHSCLL